MKTISLIVCCISAVLAFQENCKFLGKNLHKSNAYAVRSESRCKSFCNLLHMKNCKWDGYNGLCVLPTKPAKNGFQVNTSYTCPRLCNLATDCNLWNFESQRRSPGSGYCELFEDHRRIESCPHGKKCECGAMRSKANLRAALQRSIRTMTRRRSRRSMKYGN